MVRMTVSRVWKIYKATCIKTGRAYIGLTAKSVKNRWANHVWRAGSKRPLSERAILHRAILKYGAASFVIETLSVHPSLEEASAAEQSAILHHRTRLPFGYNITEGGMGTPGFRRPHTAETRAKIAAGNKGKVFSEVARVRMSAAKKGIPLSAAHVAKLSVINKARNLGGAYFSAMSKCKTGNPVPIKSHRALVAALKSLDAGTSKNIRAENGKWSTRINIGAQTRRHLGTFSSKKEAESVYRNAILARLAELDRLLGHPST